MKKFMHKFTCLLIVFSMMLQIVPVYALDLGIIGSSIDSVIEKDFSSTKEDVKEQEEIQREIEYEITSKREEDKKFFKMSDGSEMYTIYADQVHYEEDGKLVEVNNQLELKGDIYENKKASYKVRYEKESKNGEMFEIEKDGYKISMTLKNSKKVTGKKQKKNTNKKTKAEKIDKKQEVENISSSFNYEEIQENVDIKYDTLPTKVKESIILKDKKAGKTFEYEMKLDERLEASLKEDKSIEIIDSNKKEVIYTIDPPLMYDSELTFSSDIDVELIKKDYGYILKIIPSKKWLNDKSRKYPVTIDPTVETSQVRNQIDDVFIFESDGNYAPYDRANAHILRVGSSRFPNVNKKPTRSLIKFTLPTLNTGDQVIDANLSLFSYACSLESGISCPAGKTIEMNVHKMTTDWNWSNANWARLGGSNNYEAKVYDYVNFLFD